MPSGSLTKTPKQDLSKEDRTGKSVGRSSGDRDASSVVSANGNIISASAKSSAPSTRSSDMHGSDSKQENAATKSSDTRVSLLKDDGVEILDAPRPSSRSVHSPRTENASIASKSSDKQQKRASPAEDADRLSKRRKGDIDMKDVDSEVRISERERSVDARFGDLDKSVDEQGVYRASDKLSDRTKDKASERHDKDHRERPERPDKSRVDDLPEKARDRSMERYGRERSVERVQERGSDRNFDRLAEKGKDDRSKARYNDTSLEKSQVDDRFHGQNLPPPPPLPPHMIPQSVNAGRREEDVDRRFGTTRHAQKLSPRHDEKERRRSEESLVSQEDAKRRREDDFRDRKRDDRDGLAMKVCNVCACVMFINLDFYLAPLHVIFETFACCV